MTVRTDGHQDQTSSTNAVAAPRAPVADGQKRSKGHASSSVVERTRPERNRRGASFALGAPLTAAFIGGLLVIENLANAEPPDEDDIATSADEALLFEDNIGEQADLAPSSSSAAAAAAADLSEDAGSALNPEAAPSEDGSFR